MFLTLLLLVLMQGNLMLMHFLPVIDISEVSNLKDSASIYEQRDIVQRKGFEMGDALSKFGFLYVTGHGIDKQLVEDSFQASKDFFLNHSSVHKRYRRRKGVLLGYVDGLNERDFPDRPPDLKQAYDVVRNSAEFVAIPKREKSVMTHLWISFCKTSDMILKLLASSTKEPISYYAKAHKHIGNIEENTSTMRLLYYPKVTKQLEWNQSRISEHTDFGTFTMLLQDNVGGLQILDENGLYRSVPPIPDALVINVGDLLQLWSNNYFRSTIHRVVPRVAYPTARQSIAFFTNPDNSFVIHSDSGRKSVLDHMKERNDATVFNN